MDLSIKHVKELIDKGILNVHHVSISDNVADILTKNPNKIVFS